MTENEPNVQLTDLIERVADILLVFEGVGDGDYSLRLRKDLPDDKPMMMLYDGINDMIASLGEEQERNVAYQKELEEKLAMIQHQREAIKELSTPIIEVWKGVLCLPVVGVMDTTRSSAMTESLLHAIVEKEATCAIVDITGIQVMDTATADHFLRTTRAVRLLGVQCFLTGINPSIALTMQTMGMDLDEVRTLRSLRDALKLYIESRHRIRLGDRASSSDVESE